MSMVKEISNVVLKQVGDGDESAFKSLFDTYRPNIYTTALRVTNNEWMAEDIVQDTFVKVWINRHLLHSLDNFEAWLYVLAKNITLNIIKKQDSYKAYAQEEARAALIRVYPEADYLVQDKEFQRMLQEAVDRLPPKQKETYRLIREQYLKRDEAANILHVSPETVKWNLDQAMKSIRAYCLANMKEMPFVVLLHFFLKYF
ncbi:RNA polymerase sigma factor [Sphingobacterium sp. LRF_L2]|uniref:RNA polymerase sigma factor n=1 Tax=Sphingobacterium sp. LRF_L2 TaxID=3369421 RepID=UPI003F6045F3